MEPTEELANWKDNASLLYDCLLTHILEWPSLSCQFLPNNGDVPVNLSTEEEAVESLLIGTHTASGEPNAVLVLDILVPNESAAVERSFASYNDYAGFGYGKSPTKVHVRHALKHPVGEPIRVRAMPQNTNVFGSISTGGAVTIMDASGLEQLERFDWDCLQSAKTLSLVGHQQEGWALDWAPLQEGWLATGADDAKVCIWDIQKRPEVPLSNGLGGSSKETTVALGIKPVYCLDKHTAAVQDVAWHPSHTALVFSVGDDGAYILWDTRKQGCVEVIHRSAGRGKSINAIAVNPCRPVLFATGGEEQDIVIWDMRQPREPVYRLSDHGSTISRLQWNPSSERYLASSREDRFIVLWDLYSIGKEVQSEDTADGPPELLFTHAGHTAMVHDFSWNPNSNIMLASVSEDNQLHLWSVNDTIAYSDSSDSDTDDSSEFEVE